MKSVAFVEHKDRELDLLCLARMRLKRDFDIDLEILNVSADAPRVLRGPVPRAVFFSSFYSSQWPLRRDYVSAWPNARVVNLAWEQIFCPIDELMHRPLDEFARAKVRYLAWSADYQSYLQRNGVDAKNVTIIGHPLYQLYDAPYREYFKPRAVLAKEHGIDAAKPWVFIPENYGFLFLSDAAIASFASPELPESDLRDIRSYCRSSMAALGHWAEALARIGNVEVVFRPRPSVDAAALREFLKHKCGISREHFKLTKAETAREWVLASDVVMSSYSTVLIEALSRERPFVGSSQRPCPDSSSMSGAAWSALWQRKTSSWTLQRQSPMTAARSVCVPGRERNSFRQAIPSIVLSRPWRSRSRHHIWTAGQRSMVPTPSECPIG